MSRKIKIIELLNLLAENKIKRGTKIKYLGTIYVVDFPNLCGIYPEGTTARADSLFSRLDICNLNYEVEILEEEGDIQLFEQEWFDNYEGVISVAGIDLAVKMNELIKKVNELSRKMNEEE